jgi:hypothetical protein
VVFKDLAALFPDARFVYTRRDPIVWGRSMHGFMRRHRALWRGLQWAHDCGVPVPPVDRIYTAM